MFTRQSPGDLLDQVEVELVAVPTRLETWSVSVIRVPRSEEVPVGVTLLPVLDAERSSPPRGRSSTIVSGGVAVLERRGGGR